MLVAGIPEGQYPDPGSDRGAAGRSGAALCRRRRGAGQIGNHHARGCAGGHPHGRGVQGSSAQLGHVPAGPHRQAGSAWSIWWPTARSCPRCSRSGPSRREPWPPRSAAARTRAIPAPLAQREGLALVRERLGQAGATNRVVAHGRRAAGVRATEAIPRGGSGRHRSRPSGARRLLAYHGHPRGALAGAARRPSSRTCSCSGMRPCFRCSGSTATRASPSW